MKRNIKNGQGITYSIFSGNKLNQNDIQSIINYSNALKSGTNLGKAWKDNIAGCSVAAKQYVLDAKKAGKSTEQLISELNSAPKTFQAATIATQALSAVLNMAVSFGITLAIQGLVQWLDSYVNAAADAKEGAEALASKMQDFDSSVAENTKNLSSLNSKYQELSKHVNLLGENVSGSTQEYEEYKDIVKQISEIMPNLSVRFNSQGEAIGFTDGKLKDLTKTYEEYRKKTANDFFSNGDGEGNTVKDIVDNYKNQTDRAWYDNIWNKAGSFLVGSDWIGHASASDSLFGKAFRLFGGTNNPIVKWFTSSLDIDPSLESYLEQLGKSNREKKTFYENLQNLSQEKFGEITEFTNILGHDVKDISEMGDKEFGEFKKVLQNEANRYANEIEAAADKMKLIISQKLQTKDGYYKLDDKTKDNISSMVSGLNDALLQELAIEDEIDASNFADTLMKMFSKDTSFKDAFDSLFGKDLDNLPIDQYIAKVRENIGLIGDKLNLSKKGKDELTTSLGFDNLDELLNDYNGAIQSAVDKWNLNDSQKNDLEKFFEVNSINTEDEIDTWKEIAAEAKNAADAKRKYLSMNAVNKNSQNLEDMQNSYKTVSGNITALTTALSESVSGSGMSTDSISAITAMFSDLKSYDADKLLDKTANGIRLNTQELEKLKKEYDDNTAKEFYENVEDAYNSWQTALINGENKSVTDELYNQYIQAAQLADQYVGLTSAYNTWQNAMSTANEGDMYDSIYNNIKSVKDLYKKGLVGTDDFRSYVDLISPKDLSGASTEEVVSAYQASIGKIQRYFTDGHKGAENFLNDVHKINAEWAHMNKDGTWEIDFSAGGTSDKDVAKKLGIDVEAVQAILRKLIDYGFDIDLGSSLDSLAMMEKSADKAYTKLKKLGEIGKKTKIEFDTGDISKVNEQITKAEKVLNKFRNEDGTINTDIEGAEEAQSILVKLLTEKQELEKPAILQVSTDDLSGKAASVVTMLQKIQQDINTYDIQVAVGADTTKAEKKINKDIKAIKSNYGNELADIHVNLSNIDTARRELSTLTKDDIDVMVNAIINHKEVDEYKKEKEEKTLKVKTEVDETAVNSFMAKTIEKTIKAKVEIDEKSTTTSKNTNEKNSGAKKTDAREVHEKKKSKAKVDGTFNNLKKTLSARGFANASGNISVPKDQTTLINELGEELIVRDGRWFTVKGGAQFTELKKGDIVFNHKQTKQLLENGKITSSNNRGKTAYAGGSTGSGKPGWTYYSSSNNKSKSKKESKGEKKSKEKKKNSKEEIDWMDRKVTVHNNKLSETQKLYDAIAVSMKKADSSALVKKENANLNEQIKILRKLRTAYTVQARKYQSQANKYAKRNLSKDLQNKVKNGKIKGSYSQLVKQYGEKTATKIQKAIDLYNKASNAKQNRADANKQINDAKINKHQNRIDLAQSRIDKAGARKELAQYSQKNKYIDNEIKYTKQLYNHQIEIARLNKDNEEMARLRAERDKKILDYQVEQLQNYADENEAAYNLKDTQASMKTDYKEKNALSKQAVASMKSQYSYLIKIAKKQGDTVEASRLQLEMEKKVNEALLQRVQNVSDDYENRLIGLNRQAQVWDNAMSLAEAKGKTINADFYNKQANVEYQMLLKKKEALKDAKAVIDDIKKEDPDFINNPEWYKAIQIYNDLCNEVEQAEINFAKLERQAVQANWAIAESAQEAVDNLISESEAYKNIFGYKDMFDKDGVITKEGTATVALDVYDIGSHITKIKKYNKEIDKLNDLYKKGKISVEDYDEQMQKYREGIMDSTEAIYSLRDSIKSLIEEGLNAEFDALNDMIDKVKKNLSDASSLREYKKNIEKQTKNIAALERQIKAKSGDVSEKGRSDVQKLKLKLEEAKSDLEDTEYDKYIEDQERILDDLADDFQDYMDAQLDQVDTLLEGIISAVNNGNVNISEVIKQVGDKIGVDLSKVLTDTLDHFANTGQNNSDRDYNDTKNNLHNSSKDEFNNANKTPVMNTDENKGKEETNLPSGTNSSHRRPTEQDIKETIAMTNSFRWLYSKGFSEKDAHKMFASLDNAQALFTGLQNAASDIDAEEIYNAYWQEIKNGHAVDGEQPITSYSETQPYIKQSRKENNSKYVKKITEIFAKSRPPKNQEEYQTSNIAKYGSQMFASKYGKGKLLSSQDAKTIDGYVKKLLDVDTGKAMYNTGNTDSVLKALADINEKYNKALSNAVKSNTVSSINLGGFSKGGVIEASTITKAVKDNGDDVLISAHSGEAVLTPKQVQAIRELNATLEKEREMYAASKSLEDQPGMYLAPKYVEPENVIIRDTNKPIPNQNINNGSNMYGDMNIHLDGSNIKDPDTFADSFITSMQNSSKMRKAFGLAEASNLTKDRMAIYRI